MRVGGAMKRGKKAGIVWRPVEVVLLAVFVFLVVFLVWAVREIDRQESRSVNKIQIHSQEKDDDISHIVERGIAAEEAIDRSYDSWEQSSSSSADSAADSIGGVFDETSY